MALALRLMRFLSAAAVLAALMALPARAAGTNWYVATTGNDIANSCTSFASPCQTIQAAINKASTGDIINVAAGTYPEPALGPLTVNKTLTLLGAQNGADARGRGAAESIVTDPQGTSVSASNVVIDGFTVQNSIVAAFTGYGIWLNPRVSGTQIVNNIIQDNIVGIGLANNTSTQAVIEHNLIRNNNQPGGASGTGIYTDEFVGGPTVTNVLVKENTVSGNKDAGIDVSNTDFANGVFGLDVSANSFDSNGRGVLLFNTHNSSIEGNSITNSTFVGSGAVRLFDNNSSIDIESNDLITGAGNGIRLSASGAPSSNVTIHENNIENSRAATGCSFYR